MRAFGFAICLPLGCNLLNSYAYFLYLNNGRRNRRSIHSQFPTTNTWIQRCWPRLEWCITRSRMNRCDAWLSRAKESVCTLHLFFLSFSWCYILSPRKFFTAENTTKVWRNCLSESDCLGRLGGTLTGVFIVCPFSSDFTQLKLVRRSRPIEREKDQGLDSGVKFCFF